ncbi:MULTISPECIES: rod shape-determining protein MreC [unclassified Acidovorax]|uniref:rod shape-determining protein MreC n=1 Tax=unclassified Acidovorax TaxID=2684926 RepID=UPI000B3F838D|nr:MULTISPECIES: rod shape-determining protein MreC [unclassified Acidovorax]MBP3979555.1 rod shape-determining protein MreC [Acidovorax sp. JG5]
MSLGTLERSAPPFFKQGPSALSKLALYSALALFLMVADARFQLTGALRQAVAAVIYPVQWLMLQPVEFIAQGSGYFQSLRKAQEDADAARKQMTLMSQRSIQAEQLMQENARLRQLLDLRTRLETPAQAAQVLYDTADPYTRRVVVDRGRTAGVELGAPVLDEKGVLGQVTRVHPFVSEVTLLIDRDQAIPVLNIRTGVRGVAYGDPVAGHAGGMELRFMPANADILEGDLLTTSGVDGLYPPGLPVAKVVRVERRADSAFARIYCAPVAGVQGARHVMLLKPAAEPMPERPEPDAALPGKKGARK